VAGTFYKQMLKSLRSTVDKAEYFHGGRAEEVFEAQLDQQVAEDLAARQGGVFADKLYDAFIHRR
jgi:Rod binding domain-containing protein